MASLTHAHLQRRYALVIAVILVATIGLIGGVVVFGTSSATIVISPRIQSITVDQTLTVASENTSLTVKGTATTSVVTATVIATPATTGTPIDAHASGTMVVINKSTKDQPLAAGTRFQAANGQIVRSQRRIDVPAGQEVSVTVVADALGTAGNLPAGKFIIVALWSGLQQTIYGDLSTDMTGGTTLGGATLDLQRLTAATDEAVKKLSAEHHSSEGALVSLSPKKVQTNPVPSVPSAEYSVTVSMTKTTITYLSTDILTNLQERLNQKLPQGFSLLKQDQPSITLAANSSSTSPSLQASLTATIGVKSDDAALRPEAFLGKPVNEVKQHIAALPSVSGVSITLEPRWRRTMPNEAAAIHISIQP